MHQRLRVVAVAVFTVVLCLVARAQNPVLAPPSGRSSGPAKDLPSGTSSIAGRVVEAGSQHGIGLAEVTVSAADIPNSARRIVTADGDGNFLIEGIPTGSYYLSVTRPDWMAGSFGRLRPGGPSRRMTLVADERRTGVVVSMWRPAAISGSVRDEQNEPLAGARVQLFARAFYAGVPRLVRGAAAVTDARGLYRVRGLVPGDYVVGINIPPRDGLIARGDGDAYEPLFFPAATVATQALVMTLSSGEERPGVDFESRTVPAFSVSGVVTVEGLVAADTTITLAPVVGDLVELTPELQTRPLDSGAFRFGRVAAGDYVLRVVAGVADKTEASRFPRGAAWAETRISVVDRPITDLTIPLQPGFRVSGSVQFKGASPLAAIDPVLGLGVSLTLADGTSDRFTFVSVDSGGRFVATGILPGRYLLEMAGIANLSGWSLASAIYRGVDITDEPLDLTEDVSDVVVTLTDQPTRISGRVTTADAPNKDATVTLFPTDDRAWTLRGRFPRRLRNVRASTDGGYSLVNLPPGTYLIVALNSDEAIDEWSDPAYLKRLSAVATRIEVRASERIDRDLVTTHVR